MVSPIFKAMDKTDTHNYRPINILPVVLKVIEKWVDKQLIEHLCISRNPLHPMQFRFRTHHSTEGALSVFSEKNRCFLDKSGCVGAVFLDLKMAFYTIDHNFILANLTHFNFFRNSHKMDEILSDQQTAVCCGQRCQIRLSGMYYSPTGFHSRTDFFFFTLYQRPSRSMQKHSYTNVCRRCSNIYTSKKYTGSWSHSYICNGSKTDFPNFVSF